MYMRQSVATELNSHNLGVLYYPNTIRNKDATFELQLPQIYKIMQAYGEANTTKHFVTYMITT